jgi:hypothetical protein
VPGGHPLNLGLQDAYRRLGVKSGVLPGPEDVTPVLIVGSVVDTLASELFEARGMIGSSPLRALLANAVGFELHSRAPGGILLQQFYMIQHSQGGVTSAWLSLGNQSLLSTPVSHPILNIGGVPVQSVAFHDSSVAASLPADAQELPVYTVSGSTLPQTLDLSPLRIYVPSGVILSIILQATDTPELGIILSWRELASIPGTP